MNSSQMLLFFIFMYNAYFQKNACNIRIKIVIYIYQRGIIHGLKVCRIRLFVSFKP